MKNKLLMLTAIMLLFFSVASYGQSAAIDVQKELKQKALKARAESQNNNLDNGKQNQESSVQKPFESKAKPYLDENDPYQGRKEEFLSRLTVKELPIDFPKYDKSYGVKNYNHIVDDYLSKHLDIVQPHLRSKLTR